MLGEKTRGRRQIQIADDLTVNNIYTDLKIGAFGEHREENVISLLNEQITEREKILNSISLYDSNRRQRVLTLYA